MQSRYYDPVVGRFINADGYASTGQGIVGNNMFAYCLNNPTLYTDNTGNYAASINPNSSCYDAHGAGGGGGIPLPLPNLVDIIDEAVTGVSLAVSYAYRQYTKSIKASMEGMPPGNYPVTHHIIPYGEFSARSDLVTDQLHRAQDIMVSAEVFPETDLCNQLPLSATYHMSLHTDEYILMVTAPIIALGENPDPYQVYSVLFDLRIVIAGNDPYAFGY